VLTVTSVSAVWRWRGYRGAKGRLLPAALVPRRHLSAHSLIWRRGTLSLTLSSSLVMFLFWIWLTTRSCALQNAHADIVTSVEWRTSTKHGEKKHQLVSWSKDQHLKFWKIDQPIYVRIDVFCIASQGWRDSVVQV
jgi:hypothetical protein